MPTILRPTVPSCEIRRSSFPHSSYSKESSLLSTLGPLLPWLVAPGMSRSYNCEFSQSRLDIPTPAVEISLLNAPLPPLSPSAILRPMKFKILQDNLRKILWERIEAGELTGLRLAQQTGFKQAHISNFLNRKRGFSLEGMDKVLNVQHLSVLDLLDPAEVNQRASILPPSADEFENVLLTDASTA